MDNMNENFNNEEMTLYKLTSDLIMEKKIFPCYLQAIIDLTYSELADKGYLYHNTDIDKYLPTEKGEAVGIKAKTELFGEKEYTKAMFSGEAVAMAKDIALSKVAYAKENKKISSRYPFLKERAHGVFNGKNIAFKRVWGHHYFTDEEIKDLLDGKTISIEYVNKKGEIKATKGNLQRHKGKDIYCYYRFTPEFNGWFGN